MVTDHPFKRSAKAQALHRLHLKLQRDHLVLVRDRHLEWMHGAKDPRVCEYHRSLADSFDQLLGHYEDLLAALGQEDHH